MNHIIIEASRSDLITKHNIVPDGRADYVCTGTRVRVRCGTAWGTFRGVTDTGIVIVTWDRDGMPVAVARKFAETLRAGSLRAEVRGDEIVFTGGMYGEHSLYLPASSQERVQAHWDGYVSNNNGG